MNIVKTNAYLEVGGGLVSAISLTSMSFYGLWPIIGTMPILRFMRIATYVSYTIVTKLSWGTTPICEH